jgi:hypothetical protein
VKSQGGLQPKDDKDALDKIKNIVDKIGILIRQVLAA